MVAQPVSSRRYVGYHVRPGREQRSHRTRAPRLGWFGSPPLYHIGYLTSCMSYLVLARKWRPKKFAEVVGQQHVLRALINGLDQDRLHHAFCLPAPAEWVKPHWLEYLPNLSIVNKASALLPVASVIAVLKSTTVVLLI